MVGDPKWSCAWIVDKLYLTEIRVRKAWAVIQQEQHDSNIVSTIALTPGAASVPLSLSVEIRMNETTCAENHARHEEQTECLPIFYCPQFENLGHGNLLEKLENQGYDKNRYDSETDENHANSLPA
jgi:hypothetical protein